MAPATTTTTTTSSYHTGYPGDLKFPGRCASFETNFSQTKFLETNFFQLATKILSIIIIIIMMIILFVTREEVPRLTVT